MYVKDALRMLDEKGENLKSIILSGADNAIFKAVLSAEILKHRVKGLHQVNRTHSLTVTDIYEPLEFGLEEIRIDTKLVILEIMLSKTAPENKEQLVGYQAPLEYEVVEKSILEHNLKMLEIKRIKQKKSRNRRLQN